MLLFTRQRLLWTGRKVKNRMVTRTSRRRPGVLGLYGISIAVVTVVDKSCHNLLRPLLGDLHLIHGRRHAIVRSSLVGDRVYRHMGSGAINYLHMGSGAINYLHMDLLRVHLTI
ncbi:hypothetical protein SUGI_1006830 [Cryptomeria japonica]|nr:hypothetical protein SUGI_1006830 [Cryptomeria japonica]